MKTNNKSKQRLFEVMGKVDNTFKPKLNEMFDDDYVDPIQFAKQKARGSEDYHKQMYNDALEYVGGLDKWNSLTDGEKDEVYRIVEPEMNEIYGTPNPLGSHKAKQIQEIFGLSQKEKNSKQLKQKIEQAKQEVSKSRPAATAFAQPGANNTSESINELMKVRLNLLKHDMPTVMELLPDLFTDNQGYVRAKLGGRIDGLVLRKWAFVIDDNGNIMTDSNGNTIDGRDKEYLIQQLDNLLQNPIKEESPKGGGVNPKYTHFAVLKNISPEVDGKIVNGWDYSGYDPAELREFKRDYFMEDIKDMQIIPKNVNIVTTKYLQKKGINPFDFKYWYLSQNPENQ